MATINGIVKETNNGVARQVYCYNRASGALAASVVSSASDGTFSITGLDSAQQYFLVALDDNAGMQLNAQVYDRITPL